MGMEKHLKDTFNSLTKKLPPRIIGRSRKELMRRVGNNRGVYLIFKKGESMPIYIGSAGKMIKGGSWNNSTIRKRMFQANTPYHFDKKTDLLCYGPKTTGVPPAGYRHSIPLDAIEIITIELEAPYAPSALEHLLIQGFINQYGDLPEANQKI